MSPKQIEGMLKTQEIKATLPLDFPERTNEGHSAPAYNTLLVSDTFIIEKSRITTAGKFVAHALDRLAWILRIMFRAWHAKGSKFKM